MSAPAGVLAIVALFTIGAPSSSRVVNGTSTLASPLYWVSPEEGSSRTFHVWSPSVRLSSIPVTVWGVFHVDVEKFSAAGATRPSVGAWLETVTTTAPEGLVRNLTGTVAVVPYSNSVLVPAPTIRLGSSAYTVM